MKPVTWFSTITRPRSHLIATLCVWGWFLAVLVGVDSVPQPAPALEASAATGAAVWHFAMMKRCSGGSTPAVGSSSIRGDQASDGRC